MLYALALLAGCASRQPAPVIERTAPTTTVEVPLAAPAPVAASSDVVASEQGVGWYTVRKGDTLYSIALDHGHSYRDLAAWNALEDPNKIQVGQQLRVAPAEGATSVAVTRPVAAPTSVEARPLGTAAANTETLKREPKGGKLPYSEQALAQLQKPEAFVAPSSVPEPRPEARPETKPAVVDPDALDWTWPTNGKVIAGFVEGGNKGIDIAAKLGDPVQAAAAGKVVYAGTGLRGYGKLVIVKHNPSFLSAYAHNSQILVKEGQSVAKGQKIAEAGASDSDQPMLHFEIRRQGKPVDPLKQLPSR